MAKDKTTILVGNVGRRPPVFRGFFTALILALMASPSAVAQQPSERAATGPHAPDAAPSGTPTQTGTGANTSAAPPNDARTGHDQDGSVSASDQELLQAMDPQHQALFRQYLEWRKTH
jgi:hypothetical protein